MKNAFQEFLMQPSLSNWTITENMSFQKFFNVIKYVKLKLHRKRMSTFQIAKSVSFYFNHCEMCFISFMQSNQLKWILSTKYVKKKSQKCSYSQICWYPFWKLNRWISRVFCKPFINYFYCKKLFYKEFNAAKSVKISLDYWKILF